MGRDRIIPYAALRTQHIKLDPFFENPWDGFKLLDNIDCDKLFNLFWKGKYV